jgi:hypothetical protein
MVEIMKNVKKHGKEAIQIPAFGANKYFRQVFGQVEGVVDIINKQLKKHLQLRVVEYTVKQLPRRDQDVLINGDIEVFHRFMVGSLGYWAEQISEVNNFFTQSKVFEIKEEQTGKRSSSNLHLLTESEVSNNMNLAVEERNEISRYVDHADSSSYDPFEDNLATLNAATNFVPSGDQVRVPINGRGIIDSKTVSKHHAAITASNAAKQACIKGPLCPQKDKGCPYNHSDVTIFEELKTKIEQHIEMIKKGRNNKLHLTVEQMENILNIIQQNGDEALKEQLDGITVENLYQVLESGSRLSPAHIPGEIDAGRQSG